MVAGPFCRVWPAWEASKSRTGLHRSGAMLRTATPMGPERSPVSNSPIALR
jgi:hypothetical protein